jgi:hypothetical protein
MCVVAESKHPSAPDAKGNAFQKLTLRGVSVDATVLHVRDQESVACD